MVLRALAAFSLLLLACGEANAQACAPGMPCWSSTTRPSGPSLGQSGYNTTTNRPEFWNGTRWNSQASIYNVADFAGSVQNALTAAAATGGVVLVEPGTYPQTQPLSISSNTQLVCRPGANITATDAGWLGGGNKVLLTNANHGAGSITDHDIVVQGCTFTALGSFTTDGGYHHIDFRMAQHVRVDSKNVFSGGGNGTAFLASDDTVVSDNYMSGAINACYDHWDGPAHLVVRNNFCINTANYGVLVTGTNTAATSAGNADSGVITGNVITLTSATGQAGVWLNGIGAAGSGASRILVTNNIITGGGTANFTCLKVTGLSVDDTFDNNICSNTASNSLGAQTGSDSGGTPSNTMFVNNTFNNVNVSGGNIAVIQLNSPGALAYNNRIIGGTYPSAIWMSSTNNVAMDNIISGGSGNKYNTAGATNPIFSDPPGGRLQLLFDTVASASAEIDLALIPAGYSTLLLDCHDILVGTNNVNVNLQVGESTGPTWKTASYNYTAAAYDSAGASNPRATGGSANGILLNSKAANSSFPLAVKAWVQMGPASNYKMINWTTTYMSATDASNLTWVTGNGAYVGDTGTITGLRIIPSSGNIASGECKLFAVN